jgi:glycerophosphoryl diester phosphodiesterase
MTAFRKLEIIAHRGYSARAPENTLAALEAAIAAGADAVEFDIQPAACGTPILFHDPMLGRTTNGVGPVKRRALGILKALDAGSWFGPDFKGETIPTQEEALERVKGRVEQVYQDIKGYRELEDLDRMVEITRRTGMASAAVLVSSNWVVMNHLRRVAPEIRRAYLVESAEGFPEAMDRSALDGGSLLSMEIGFSLGGPEKVLEAVESGVEVVTWTVNDPGMAAQALALGVRRFTTDEVEALLAWRGSLG